MSLITSLVGITVAILGAALAAYLAQILIGHNRDRARDTSVTAVLEGNRINLDVTGRPSFKEIEQAIRLALGEHNRGTENLQKVFVINEGNEEEWIELGDALRKIGRHYEAINSLDRALTINPKHHGAWFQKGLVLGELKRFDEAIESYEQALLFNPKYVDALVNKGIILSNQNREGEALYAFNEVLKIDPRHHIARSFSRVSK